MANELTLSASLRFEKNSQVAQFYRGSRQFTVSGDEMIDMIVPVGTSEEAMPLGEIGTLGYCLVHNMDATNYVQIRTGTSGTAMIRLNAGEFALFRFGSGVTAPYWIADTGSCRCRVMIIEA